MCVGLGLAVAAWLLPASIHIVDWNAGGPARVAWLAPFWQLWIALAAAAIAVLTIGDALNPLALLWLWAVPYLPWIPDRAPALLVLAGPLRWGVLALALGGVTANAASRSRLDLRIVRWPDRRIVFGISVAVYLGLGLYSAAEVGPSADEPHYLVITQSLLRDGDLAIENNHARGDYREYYNDTLGPDFLRRGRHEVIYSIHAPGLPALLVPAYAIAGYRGAVAMVAWFGALAALAVFDVALLLTGPGVALATWAAVCLTVPWIPHSWLIFPEMPGALVVAWATLWLYRPVPSPVRAWLWRGAALAILPWLHTKFVILLVAMTGALLLRVWRRPKTAAALVVPVVISLTLWFAFFYQLYGVPDPQAPYGDFAARYVLFANIPRGVLGFLFDQKFGLAVYAPVYLLTIAGGWVLLRRPGSRLFAAVLVATAGLFVASSARMYMWWGGSSAPARFLVPILPLVAPFVAIAFQELRSAAARAAAALLLMVSLAIAAAGVVSPRQSMLLSSPHGLANLVAAVKGASPLPYLLPTFTEDQVVAPLRLLAPWTVAALMALAVVIALSRMKVQRAGIAATFAGLATFVVGGAVLAGAPAQDRVRHEIARRGRVDLMRAWDAGRLRGFDYARRATITDRQMLDLAAIRLTREEGALTTETKRLAGPIALAAGHYSASVGFDGDAPTQDGTASVLLGSIVPIARGSVNGSLPFDMPVDADVSVAVSSAALAASARQVTIVAESIVPRSTRPDVDVHSIESIGGAPGAFIVYADDNTYPEGGVFWTRGTRAGKILVDAGDASTLVLTVHVGPAGGLVRLVVGGEDRSLTLARDETRQVAIPLSRTFHLVPVLVQASAQFRPSDREPGAIDRRWLGCQVRVGLR